MRLPRIAGPTLVHLLLAADTLRLATARAPGRWRRVHP